MLHHTTNIISQGVKHENPLMTPSIVTNYFKHPKQLISKQKYTTTPLLCANLRSLQLASSVINAVLPFRLQCLPTATTCHCPQSHSIKFYWPA